MGRPLALATRFLAVLGMLAAAPPPRALAASSTFVVDPTLGNSSFTAVFDAALGERITAVSSAIDCTLTVDEAALEGRATCSVPLPSIRVDNEDTKSEHFAEWATNKKTEPATCEFRLEISRVKLAPPVDAKAPAPFTTEGKFTICGRERDDGGTERISGTVVHLPAGAYGPERTLRIRARIEEFDRERYGVSPKATAGWLARVQQLADVVAARGVIEVSAFATAAAAAGAEKAE